METIIKLSPAELNITLLEKIKSFIGSKTNVEVTISLNEYNPSYASELDYSIAQAVNPENLLNFTMEEFMGYSPASKNE